MYKNIKNIKVVIFTGLLLLFNVVSAELIKNNTSVNSNVASIMDWYSQLLSKNPQNKFVDYYPKQIQQIKIVKLNLTDSKQTNKHKFNVDLLITYKNADKLISKVINETLVFSLSSEKPKLNNIIRNKETLTKSSKSKKYNQLYYQQRHFIYTWLAWLDDDMRLPISANKATYNIDIGAKHIAGDVFASLKKRKRYLYKGEHLLESMAMEKLKNNTFVFKIIVQYKGVNSDNKKVIAKIQQTIHAKFKNNGWQIMSIKEKHLLPDIAPWIGFVC